MTGVIVDIQRASVHDGPGLRTTVFFKGCPLHCLWCHNPESIAFEPQELFYPEKCIGCGHCKEGCFSGARVTCGREMTVEALMEAILQDLPFFRTQGGVTFSGGEPLAQPDFLKALLKACKAEGIHTAIETSLTIFDEEVFSLLDLVMADVKIWDEEKHRRYCGGSALRIRENLLKAAAMGKPMIVRTPVVPGVNDGEEELLRIAKFLAPIPQVQRYQLLPYHPLGQEKARALGLQRPEFPIPSRERMAHLKQLCDLTALRQAEREKQE